VVIAVKDESGSAERPELQGQVASVHLDQAHVMAKGEVDGVELVEGLGVRGDAHFGATVQHRSRVRQDPTQPNLRQVHLIQRELIEDLAGRGFSVRPGQMGENILTRGVDLLSLPKSTILSIGSAAALLVTGLRNPCAQLNGIHDGLLTAVLHRGSNGELVLRGGIMAIVINSGWVRAGDPISVHLPPEPHRQLTPV
jgi:MOSC domain-containing protein YiiM